MNGSLFLNLMQVYRIYCPLSLPSKLAVKNKVQKKETPNKNTKHDKCVAINLLAIKILENSIIYQDLALGLRKFSGLKNSALPLII